MLALYLQILLLMLGAYLCGAVLAAVVRRGLLLRTRPLPAVVQRVDPLPELAQAPPTARFGRVGAEVERTEPGARVADAVAAAGASAPATDAPRVARPAAAADVPKGPPDDLQRIKGIDADTASALNQLGVRSYAEIAAFTPAEVHRIGAALVLDGRIGRENWIEQAEVLARGGETQFARRRARGETANAAPTGDEGEPRALSTEPGAEAGLEARSEAAAGASPDDAWAAAAADSDDRLAGPPAPASQPGAEQLPDAHSPQAPEEPETAPVAAGRAPSPATPAAADTDPDVSGRAAFADAAPAPPELPLAARAASSGPAPHEDLLRILGMTHELAALLAREGVLRYSQIAQWSTADVRRLEERLAISGVIARENWIEQAQILSRGGDTAFSREYDRRTRAGAPPDTPIPGGEGRAAVNVLGALRSVRAEAYHNPEPGPQAAQRAASRVLRATRPDDLKRIRGIGVLIEKKLNAMGIFGYEQIANWTAEDIDRVSQSLDFKGRIERENWVEQARILASGGATEFARRFDRGERG